MAASPKRWISSRLHAHLTPVTSPRDGGQCASSPLMKTTPLLPPLRPLRAQPRRAVSGRRSAGARCDRGGCGRREVHKKLRPQLRLGRRRRRCMARASHLLIVRSSVVPRNFLTFAVDPTIPICTHTPDPTGSSRVRAPPSRQMPSHSRSTSRDTVWISAVASAATAGLSALALR
jgi:hypothetical protein